MMDFQQIQELIKLVNKSKLREFVLKEGDFKLIIKAQHEDDGSNHQAQNIVYSAPQVMSQAAQVSSPSATEPSPAFAPAPTALPPAANTKEIRSPMVGTFYRSAGPDKPQFVKIGDEIQVGQTVCIIEAMKLFNELESDISGKVIKVLVEDGKPIEYDQPLFLLEI
jgi:acetyl-CoA carboxylase biotin carboxyl carrier protein